MINDNVIPFPEAASPATSSCPRSAQGFATITSLRRHTRQAQKEAPTYQPSPIKAALSAGEIWDAISSRRVRVHYQPQYNIGSGAMVAAEALVRLVDCEGRLIYPDLFIDRAENSDLMVPLGRAVVEQVCADLADSADRGAAWQRVAINLSGNQLNADTGLPDFIDQLVASHGLLHDVLEFELTERQQLLPDSAGMGVLKALARRGSRLVLDDFGMGYSSYTYLSLPGLPISAFKLDRTLVRRLPDDRASQAIVSSLLDLAAALELEVVAEGVENDAQNAYLENSGCSHAQGYRFARPMGIADLQDFIAMQGLSDHGNLRA